jgi:prepilin-type N-terminal cleavage/methylation domain-containing protein
MLRIFRPERGDTLVEVMIAIAIVASVLGASYATAARSLRAGRQSQERSEALRYVESQIERIKFVAGGGGTGTVFKDNTSPFCVKEDNSVVDVSGTNCTFGGLYEVSVKFEQANPGNPVTNKDNLFTVVAVWDRLGSGGDRGRDSISMVYKLHPGIK